MKLSYFRSRKPFSFSPHPYDIGTLFGLWCNHDDNHFLLKIYRLSENKFEEYYAYHLSHTLENNIGSEEDFYSHVWQIVKNRIKHFEQAQQFNTSALQEHEIKIRLNRFLFTKDNWDKPCSILSGGERMRLILCCLSIGNQSPDIIILDEPTNNLDIQNIEILTNAINDYQGTLIVISHDETLLEQVNIERTIKL